MCKTFCHVHNHTEYSLLDGANRIPDMVKYARELDMSALAITDHGVMFGVMEFYWEAKKAGIKPLIGVEAYVAPQGIHQKRGDGEKNAYHLLMLAKNLEGYRNLCKLSTIAALEGYYYKPRVDHEILAAHSQGIVATSACLGSEVCQHLLRGDYDSAERNAAMYREMFGDGNFFIELQDHRIPEQARIQEGLLKIAERLHLPLVVTNDSHYMCKGDAEPHDVLLCIQTGANREDEKRFKFPTDEFYLKSPDEMGTLFREFPEALENTMRIADMCNVELEKTRAPMPKPDVPEGVDSFTHLENLAREGLASRCKDAEQKLDRLNYELNIIRSTGYGDYFLLVKEFAQHSRDKGIYFGVRGSAAGSLVSYAVGITDVDPVDYGLTFERFLNPERISMPDVDMDFEDARRDEVIQYVQEKYGKDRVAQIVTFGTLGAKAAIKDCGRVQGFTPQETDRLCKTIPTAPGWNLERAYKELAEFRGMVDADPRLMSLFETAKTVEGLARNSGVHAAGVVMSSEPLVDYIPLYRGNDDQPVTAFEMGILEKLGMLKMDFLGLSNLTVLARAVENIKQTRGIDVDLQKLEDFDKKAYDMLGRGETAGVFQLEGGGMTRWVMQLKPASIRELAAMVALYRPGPMDHIPRFIDTKFGRQKAQYLTPKMEPILQETYGVIVYQDQVMQLVQALAGFTLGKADVLRRAMGKKDAKALDSMKGEFMEGTDREGITEEIAEEVWKLLLPFAGYAFNKAHAVCYAILAYQTAYLKANFPTEYMAALLSVYLDKEDKVTSFIDECRRQKIRVLPPDINFSKGGFTIETDGRAEAIRFGLVAIKGVGEGLVEGIIKERMGIPYTHLYEFAERTKPYGMNRTALEALIKAGALDSIDRNRKNLLEYLEGALAFADAQHRARTAGQDSLFGESEPASASYPALPPVEPFSRGEILSMEKEVMGIYVSDHPLRGLERTIASVSSHSCDSVSELEDGTHVRLAGVIAKFNPRTSKRDGRKYAILTVEDFSGQANAVAYNAKYEAFKDILVKDQLVVLSGYVGVRENGSEKQVEVRVDNVEALEPALDLPTTDSMAPGTISINVMAATRDQMQRLKEVIDRHPGSYECIINVQIQQRAIPMYLTQLVDPSDGLQQEIRQSLTRVSVEVEHRVQYA
jgi:DNA polymerase-3 subunit alpha